MQPLTEQQRKEYIELKCRIVKLKSWREIIITCIPDAILMKGATPDDFAELQSALGHGLPDQLKDLLSETNGVGTHVGLELIYSTKMIIGQNLKFRDPQTLADLRMPFDHLLFFGGAEDPCAYPRLKNGKFGHQILMWDHETDGREYYASLLKDYIMRFTILSVRPLQR